MTENQLSGLAAYTVPYVLYIILSVYLLAAGGTVTTLNNGVWCNHQRRNASSQSLSVWLPPCIMHWCNTQVGKKNSAKSREKPNQLSKKNLGTSVTRGKRKGKIYIYIYTTRPDLERPPQLVHGFHPSIFPTLTHPKHRTSNSYTKSTAQWQYSAYDVVWIRRSLLYFSSFPSGCQSNLSAHLTLSTS